ncbi:hypothetical protein HDU76_013738, partial [Blyttiomyces sp. JEL0837]
MSDDEALAARTVQNEQSHQFIPNHSPKPRTLDPEQRDILAKIMQEAEENPAMVFGSSDEEDGGTHKYSLHHRHNENEDDSSESSKIASQVDAQHGKAVNAASTSLYSVPIPESLAAWLPDFLGRDSYMTLGDLEDAFVLVQVLSLISPNAVDLSWYTTDGALTCPDLAKRNRETFLTGLEVAGIELYPSLQRAIAEGEIDALVEAANVLWTWKNRQGRLQGSATAKRSSESRTVGSASRSRVERIRSGGADRNKNEITNDEITHSSECKPVTKSSNAKRDESIVDAGYDPAERSFKSCVRWVYRVLWEAGVSGNPLMISFGPLAKTQLREALGAIEDSTTKMPLASIIPLLTYGCVYYCLSRIILPEEGDFPRNVTIETLVRNEGPQPESSSWLDMDNGFLERLISGGYLDFQSELKESIKAMLGDVNPFYEPIHHNIMEAFMSAYCRVVDIDAVVSHLSNQFPDYSSQTSHPYDLEDAFVLWANICAQHLREEYQSVTSRQPSAASQNTTTHNNLSSNTSPSSSNVPLFLESWSELDDLTRDFSDGRGLCAIAAWYNLGSGALDLFKVHPRRRGASAGSSNALTEKISRSADLCFAWRVSNLRLFENAVKESGVGVPAWTPEELAGSAAMDFTQTQDDSDGFNISPQQGSTSFKACLMAYLCCLFTFCKDHIPRTQSRHRVIRVSKKRLKEVIQSDDSPISSRKPSAIAKMTTETILTTDKPQPPDMHVSNQILEHHAIVASIKDVISPPRSKDESHIEHIAMAAEINPGTMDMGSPNNAKTTTTSADTGLKPAAQKKKVKAGLVDGSFIRKKKKKPIAPAPTTLPSGSLDLVKKDEETVLANDDSAMKQKSAEEDIFIAAGPPSADIEEEITGALNENPTNAEILSVIKNPETDHANDELELEEMIVRENHPEERLDGGDYQEDEDAQASYDFLSNRESNQSRGSTSFHSNPFTSEGSRNDNHSEHGIKLDTADGQHIIVGEANTKRPVGTPQRSARSSHESGGLTLLENDCSIDNPDFSSSKAEHDMDNNSEGGMSFSNYDSTADTNTKTTKKLSRQSKNVSFSVSNKSPSGKPEYQDGLDDSDLSAPGSAPSIDVNALLEPDPSMVRREESAAFTSLQRSASKRVGFTIPESAEHGGSRENTHLGSTKAPTSNDYDDGDRGFNPPAFDVNNMLKDDDSDIEFRGESTGGAIMETDASTFMPAPKPTNNRQKNAKSRWPRPATGRNNRDSSRDKEMDFPTFYGSDEEDSSAFGSISGDQTVDSSDSYGDEPSSSRRTHLKKSDKVKQKRSQNRRRAAIRRSVRVPITGSTNKMSTPQQFQTEPVHNHQGLVSSSKAATSKSGPTMIAVPAPVETANAQKSLHFAPA